MTFRIRNPRPTYSSASASVSASALDADRDRGRQSVVRAAEHVDERDAEPLRQQVVERHVDGRPRRGRARSRGRELAAERRKRSDVSPDEPRERSRAESAWAQASSDSPVTCGAGEAAPRPTSPSSVSRRTTTFSTESVVSNAIV